MEQFIFEHNQKSAYIFGRDFAILCTKPALSVPFEVLCYFCVNNQGLLHSFGGGGPKPGSSRLTHTVNQLHAQKENAACLFHFKFLCPLCTEFTRQWEGSVMYPLEIYSSRVETEPQDWGIWAQIYIGSREKGEEHDLCC